ncbi:MAG: TIGR02449 family protein [Gammaproteobacteria bacterium]|nr:TIGR02449 family protein [Gammaproteobacteria bacterium]
MSGEILDEDLNNLEQKVDELINACRRLQDENQTLRTGHDTLLRERSKLAEKNRLARVRLETIINRLKTLEKE